MKRIAVMTSGGDSPGMNAAVRAIAKLAASRGVEVLGVCDGYAGLMEGRFRPLSRPSETARPGAHPNAQIPDPELDLVGSIGGTILGSARSKLFMEPDGRRRAAEYLNEVDGLVVIGGNGSLTGAHLLANEHGVKVVGIPGSIDNDIGCTGSAIGVDTALNTIVEACDRISDTARAHRRAFVVEVMGRQSGYLAMASAIAAGADAALFREQDRSEETLVDAVAGAIERGFADSGKRRVLIIKAEGVEIPCTRLVRKVSAKLEGRVAGGVETRATVLGHVVRGGPPSYQDRMIAGRLAMGALSALFEGKTDVMVAWQSADPGGEATADPSVQRFGLAQVIEATERLIDGTSPVTRRRVQMMEAVEGVLSL